MPLSGQTGKRRYTVFSMSVRPSVCYQTCEYDISKTNKPILIQFGKSGPLGKGHETFNFGSQEVKVEGHTRP